MKQNKKLLKKNDFSEKREIGYENNEMMCEIKTNGKLNDEKICFVLRDLQLHEYEPQRLSVNESKKCGIGLFEMMKGKTMRPKKNQTKRRKKIKNECLGEKNDYFGLDEFFEQLGDE